MKKFLLMILAVITIFLCNLTFVHAEEVEGLSEALDKIIMDRNFTQEQFDEMDREYIEEFNDRFWNYMLEPMKELGKMHTDSDEEEYAYCLNRDRPDYSYGILMSAISNKYAKQYSENNTFNYLFDKNGQYWVAMHKRGMGTAAAFSLGGTRIYDYDLITITQEMIDYLKEKESIENQLLAAEENKVDDLKVFSVGNGLTLLYIKCDSNEYLMKLYDQDASGEYVKRIQYYTLYPAKKVIDIMTDEESQMRPGLQIAARAMSITKPTYQTEAEALQSEGLLHGNDNGLDLLKPLSRIEAAAILLRTIGEGENTTQTAQTFTDVPATHWGYGAAENAHELGIINGVGDNKFAPDQTVTATEFSTMLLRSAKEPDFDWTQAVNILIDKGILTEEETQTMDLFTRGDMAKIIYEAQQNGLLKR